MKIDRIPGGEEFETVRENRKKSRNRSIVFPGKAPVRSIRGRPHIPDDRVQSGTSTALHCYFHPVPASNCIYGETFNRKELSGNML